MYNSSNNNINNNNNKNNNKDQMEHYQFCGARYISHNYTICFLNIDFY